MCSSRKLSAGIWLAFLLAGCENQDAEHLERIALKLHGRVQTAFVEAKSAWTDRIPGLASQSVEVDLATRITNRLRWDKSLADLAIQVSVTDAEVELRGFVKDAEQQKRAVELAESTIGVEKVNDALEIKEGS